jgi:hypothetical protein
MSSFRRSTLNHQSLSNFIWSVADLLRGDYKQSEYGRVILPFTVLRRLDCVLAPTKQAVLEQAETGKPDPFLLRAAGHNFFNRSTLDLGKLIGDQDNIGTNLLSYIQGFSPEVRDIFDQFEFGAQIDRLAKNGLLYQVTERFAGIDLQTFDYMLSNPPFGVEWKKVQKEVQDEHQRLGHAGRFGPGLPRVSDGSLLFLMHLLAKMRPWTEGGCRFGIVLNGSPLFTGGAGSGESEIRRYVLESDLVEAIIALPTDMFYNTGIATYVWILSNKKPAARTGKVQLIDGSGFWQKMRKSLGAKRKQMSDDQIAEVTRLFGAFVEAELATVLGADGKELAREIVIAGDAPPAAPEGGNPDLPASETNKPAPFHVYSMRQAIEEGFILDVLKNYTPYRLAFKLANGGEEWDEMEVERSAAMKGIMRWVRLHPYNISQKVQIVVEHFRENVAPLLNGKAKARPKGQCRRRALILVAHALPPDIHKRTLDLSLPNVCNVGRCRLSDFAQGSSQTAVCSSARAPVIVCAGKTRPNN